MLQRLSSASLSTGPILEANSYRPVRRISRKSSLEFCQPYMRAPEKAASGHIRSSICPSSSSSQRISETAFVIFDFETTGLNSSWDHIIEIGAKKVVNGRVVDSFSALVKPPKAIPEKVQKITGIKEHMVRNQPEIAEILPSFLRFVQDSVLVAHNARFDIGFLKRACWVNELPAPKSAICTLKMAKDLFSKSPSKKLGDLAKECKIDSKGAHRADADCEMTVGVLFAMIYKKPRQFRTLEGFVPYLSE